MEETKEALTLFSRRPEAELSRRHSLLGAMGKRWGKREATHEYSALYTSWGLEDMTVYF